MKLGTVIGASLIIAAGVVSDCVGPMSATVDALAILGGLLLGTCGSEWFLRSIEKR
jgi:hypothetical protein